MNLLIVVLFAAFIGTVSADTESSYFAWAVAVSSVLFAAVICIIILLVILLCVACRRTSNKVSADSYHSDGKNEKHTPSAGSKPVPTSASGPLANDATQRELQEALQLEHAENGHDADTSSYDNNPKRYDDEYPPHPPVRPASAHLGLSERPSMPQFGTVPPSPPSDNQPSVAPVRPAPLPPTSSPNAISLADPATPAQPVPPASERTAVAPRGAQSTHDGATKAPMANNSVISEAAAPVPAARQGVTESEREREGSIPPPPPTAPPPASAYMPASSPYAPASAAPPAPYVPHSNERDSDGLRTSGADVRTSGGVDTTPVAGASTAGAAPASRPEPAPYDDPYGTAAALAALAGPQGAARYSPPPAPAGSTTAPATLRGDPAVADGGNVEDARRAVRGPFEPPAPPSGALPPAFGVLPSGPEGDDVDVSYPPQQAAATGSVPAGAAAAAATSSPTSYARPSTAPTQRPSQPPTTAGALLYDGRPSSARASGPAVREAPSYQPAVGVGGPGGNRMGGSPPPPTYRSSSDGTRHHVD